MLKFSQHNLQKILLWLSMLFVTLSLCYEIFYNKNMSFPEWENNIVFALDVSQSMNVVDVWDFTRLNTAKRKIIDIIDKNPQNNYALNIFAWESIRILPFTTDKSLISTFLLWVDSKNLTKQGSNINSALLSASESFNEFQSWKIILISDGSDEIVDISPDIKNMYRDKNLELIVLWVGTESGWFVPSESPLSPYKIYNNERVVSTLNNQSLLSVADSLGWTYLYIDDFTDYWLLWENQNVEKFSYIFILFVLSWWAYLVVLYRSIFLKSKI